MRSWQPKCGTKPQANVARTRDLSLRSGVRDPSSAAPALFACSRVNGSSTIVRSEVTACAMAAGFSLFSLS